jgi:hypothetical protein
MPSVLRGRVGTGRRWREQVGGAGVDSGGARLDSTRLLEQGILLKESC